jgi:hypothetical protein
VPETTFTVTIADSDTSHDAEPLTATGLRDLIEAHLIAAYHNPDRISVEVEES